MIGKLSIIVPTLNEEKYLPHLLKSIANQNYKGKFEVIVVDGKSEDKTKEIASGYKDKIDNSEIVQTMSSISHQRNIGASKANGRILIFLDADTVIPKNFLSKVAQATHNREEFIIMPLILPLNGSIIDYFFVLVAYFYFFAVSFSKPVVAGMCLITTKEVHEKISGFNENAVYAEDMDYGLRAVKKGVKYHLNINIKLHASTRRKVKISRFRLGLIWLKWHRLTIKCGAITDKSKYEYAYGSHNTEDRKT